MSGRVGSRALAPASPVSPTAAALAALAMLAACADGAGRDERRAAAWGTLVFDSAAGPAAPGSSEPNLAVGPDGRVWLTWIEPAAGGAHALRIASRQGAGWSTPRTVVERRDFFLNWADFPSLAVLGDRELAVHWLQRSGAGKYAYDVRIARSPDGGATWTPGTVPHGDGTESEHGFASLWNEGGAVAAVWLDGRKYARPEAGAGKETMLVHAILDSAGRAGAEHRLDERICDCCQTSVARTSRGAIVVYRDRSDDEVRDIHAVRLVNGVWTAPAPVHRDGWRIDYCPVNGPAVAAQDERVAVAWFTASADTARVLVATSGDAGATFGAPVRVDEGAPAGRVGVVLLPDGSVLASWIERTDRGAVVRARRVAADGTLGAPATVGASSDERASGFPRIAVGGDELLVAWTVPGSPSSVRVARASLARADGS
jgi:hypothetical protein